MIVGYKRYLSFLIDALTDDYSDLGGVEEEELIFDFEQYVFSQMHLGVLCHHYGRSLYTIYDVYRWLSSKGKEEVDQNSLFQVLSWYYLDHSVFLRSIALCGVFSSVAVSLRVSLELEKTKISFKEESLKVLQSVSSSRISTVVGYEGFLDLNYTEIREFDSLFGSMDSPSSSLRKDRFVSSVIIRKFSSENPGIIIDMDGVVKCI